MSVTQPLTSVDFYSSNGFFNWVNWHL